MNISLSRYFYNTLGKQHKNEERLSFMLTAFSFFPIRLGFHSGWLLAKLNVDVLKGKV